MSVDIIPVSRTQTCAVASGRVIAFRSGVPPNLVKDYRGAEMLTSGFFFFFSTQASSPALILENLVKPNFLNQDSTSGDGKDCLTYADQVHFKSSF